MSFVAPCQRFYDSLIYKIPSIVIEVLAPKERCTVATLLCNVDFGENTSCGYCGETEIKRRPKLDNNDSRSNIGALSKRLILFNAIRDLVEAYSYIHSVSWCMRSLNTERLKNTSNHMTFHHIAYCEILPNDILPHWIELPYIYSMITFNQSHRISPHYISRRCV